MCAALGGGAHGEPSHAGNFYLTQKGKDRCSWSWEDCRKIPQWMCNSSSTIRRQQQAWPRGNTWSWLGMGLVPAETWQIVSALTTDCVMDTKPIYHRNQRENSTVRSGDDFRTPVFSQNVHPSAGRVWITVLSDTSQKTTASVQRRDCHHSTEGCPRHGLGLLRRYRALKSCWSGFGYSDQCQPASRQMKLSLSPLATHCEWHMTPCSSVRCICLHANAAFTSYENDHQNTTWQLFTDWNSWIQ